LKFLRKRFSPQDLMHVFVLCAFPIHVWSIIIMLRNVPSWILYMSGDDIVGSVAYHLMFTIFETLLIYLIILVIGLLIPKRWLPEPFLTTCAVLLIELSIMAIVFQHLVQQYSPLRWMFVACLMTLAISLIIVPRISKLQKITRLVAERLTILTFLYVFLDIIGVIVVIARNL